MAECDCDKELLVAHALGYTNPDESEIAERFLRECPHCLREFELHRRVAGVLSVRVAPSMPSDLREVLVRSAVQARRDDGPAWASPRSVRSGRISWAPVLGAGAALAALGLIIFFFVPGAGPGGSVDEVVSGGVGRGATALDEIMQLLANLQQGWTLAQGYLERLSPLTRAVRTVFGAVGVVRWAVAFFSVVSVIGLVWRLNRSSQNRSVKHA
ncbi:MAG: hypothetical protein R3E97_04960 [Candidatus Eisenbacteria bacterium]